jgi:protein-tyrosine-phosphatase
MNILFVCTGNVSRSFLAEKLFRHEALKAGLDSVNISSSGLFAYPGSAADPKMSDYLLTLDASVGSHASRQMDEKDALWAHVILVMEKMHHQRIETLWPYARPKVFLLAGFVSEDQAADDIIDPFGRSSYHYRLAQSQITLAVKNLVQRIQSIQPLDGLTGDEMLRRLRGE